MPGMRVTENGMEIRARNYSNDRGSWLEFTSSKGQWFYVEWTAKGIEFSLSEGEVIIFSLEEKDEMSRAFKTFFDSIDFEDDGI